MIIEFDKAFLEFERDAYSLLHECHFDPGAELSNFKIQIQAQNLATDIGYLSMVMRDLHQAAIHEISAEFDLENAKYNEYIKQHREKGDPNTALDDGFFRNQPRQERNISIALAKFGAAFKAFLFPLRAYQDAIYMIGLGILEQPVGGKSGMKNAVNVPERVFITKNPIGQLLTTAVPDYAMWFGSLRGQRNSVKSGAGISYNSGKNFVTGETTIAIDIHTSSENRTLISLDNVSQALQMSTKATKAIVEFGISHGKFKPRAHGNAG
jgi:hypothetical protein